MFGLGSAGIIVFVVGAFILSGLRILNEYERGVVFRLGRLIATKGPGLIYLIPMVDKMMRISLRVVTMDVPPQDVITRDNVSVKVNAVVYFKVFEPGKAIVGVEDYFYATSQLAQTTLRSILGEMDLDDLLSRREKINLQLQEILDKRTDAWGIKISSVEVKHIDLPKEMQRAMAKQAEAEREKRAKIISADAEFQASTKLSEAAEVIARHPIALQLRYLQTLAEMSTEKSSTIAFPIPIDIISHFLPKKS